MLQLQYQAHQLAFEYPFILSKGAKTHQPTLLLSLGLGRLKGYGEATEIGYYNVSVTEMIASLEKNRSVIERYALTDPLRFWHFLHHLFPGQHFLISALDMAGWDLWSRMNRKPLYALLGLSWKDIPPTDYTFGITTPEEIADRVLVKRFPVYKLKMGGNDDLAALEALRKATNAAIRVDANEGWTLQQAQELIPYLEAFDVALIEQPLHREDTEGLRLLKAQTSIPIIADEACQKETDVQHCLELYDGVNIKLSKCGGITPALRMIKAIKAAGKKVMLGGMCETNAGATALAHLLPLADYADIDGPLLLKENIGTGLQYHEGTISLPHDMGTGFNM